MTIEQSTNSFSLDWYLNRLLISLALRLSSTCAWKTVAPQGLLWLSVYASRLENLEDTGRGHLADGKRQEVRFSLSADTSTSEARVPKPYPSSPRTLQWLELSYKGVLY